MCSNNSYLDLPLIIEALPEYFNRSPGRVEQHGVVYDQLLDFNNQTAYHISMMSKDHPREGV